jgi:hypothetical protein
MSSSVDYPPIRLILFHPDHARRRAFIVFQKYATAGAGSIPKMGLYLRQKR